MLKRIIGSQVIRFYDKDGNFINEVNIIEFNSVLLDWCAFLAIVLIGTFFIGHYG